MIINQILIMMKINKTKFQIIHNKYLCMKKNIRKWNK